MAARTTKVRHDDNTRAKIQASQLVNRLQDHVYGKIDLKPTQVTAALGLLKKSIPDLSSIEAKHDVSDTLADLLKAVDGRTRGIPTGS